MLVSKQVSKMSIYAADCRNNVLNTLYCLKKHTYDTYARIWYQTKTLNVSDNDGVNSQAQQERNAVSEVARGRCVLRRLLKTDADGADVTFTVKRCIEYYGLNAVQSAQGLAIESL